MREPSPSPSAAGHPETDPRAPLLELIQLYQVEHARLLKHQEEVEHRRAAVRTAAVQEASEILLSARQEIRRVLVQTRRELVGLSAQLRAVGYETSLGQSTGGDDFQLSVGRDVRNVLREARSELSDLAREAGDLCPGGWETRPLAPSAVAMASLPEPAASPDCSIELVQSPTSGSADEMTAPSPAAQIAAHWRVLAIVLVAVAIIGAMIVSVRSSPRSDAAVATHAAEAGESAVTAATPAPDAPVASVDASDKPSAGMLSLSLEVRRPSWLRINVDGEADLGRTYREGERRTIHAAREIQLRAGDAGAVLVSLSGGAPVPLGPDGQVRTRRFAREGAPAANQAGLGQTTSQVSEGRPAPAQGIARGAELHESPAATATHGTAVPVGATDQPARTATMPDPVAAEREILDRHQRWFDAFERGDRATMASLAVDNFSLVDQRPPRGSAPGRIERTIDDLRVQVTAGIGAVLSGRITETTTADSGPAVTVAMLSEVWIQGAEDWQLVSVRMVPLTAVSTTLQ